MSADSLPSDLYQAVCAFNTDLLAQTAGGRTLLVQRLTELVRVGAGQRRAVQRKVQGSATQCTAAQASSCLLWSLPCDAAAAANYLHSMCEVAA